MKKDATHPTTEEIMETFGIDPEQIGNRNRGWGIVDELSDEEELDGIKIGDLYVVTREDSAYPVDSAVGYPIARRQDYIYRYYYYRKINKKEKESK